MGPNKETIEEGFDHIETKFQNEDDQATVSSMRKSYEDNSEIASLLEGYTGEKLLSWLNSHITEILEKLLDTREARYLSDLKSFFELKQKLTNAKSIKESIESWVDSHN